MVARRIIFSLLAFVFLSVTLIPIVHADGTDPGSGGDSKIHPWDNNDDFVIGNGPTLAFRMPFIWIVEAYSGRGMVSWSSQTATRTVTTRYWEVTYKKARSTREVTRLEAGKR